MREEVTSAFAVNLNAAPLWGGAGVGCGRSVAGEAHCSDGANMCLACDIELPPHPEPFPIEGKGVFERGGLSG
jgi:hypothetical protein